ncbi:MAG: M20/M25/M40 family metallo-hydrolase [bacterium]|nr:M20/M25/M40 family metallo-hydrolase [bacterium]
MKVEIDKSIYKRPVELLQKLIRFNTSNPPGNERECISYLNHLLEAHGIETHMFSKDARRPNLSARLKGLKGTPPLLFYGHVDVVPALERDWTYPPFEGKIADGFVWGRGALDMKGAVAMMVCAFIKAKVENVRLPGDVVLCILSDEEDLGEYGARFLVEHHPELFKGIRYALSEVGGFTFYVGGKKCYFIEVAQKQKCVIKAVIHGTSGHGSSHHSGGTMAKLAQFLDTLDKCRFPVHVTPAGERMINALADILPFPKGWLLRQLLKPKRTDTVLKILGSQGDTFTPIFHNTVNATVVKAGEKVNVVPSEAEVQLDARLLPGFGPDDIIKELRAVFDGDVDLECLHYDEGPAEPDMGMYDSLENILKKADPEGIPIPILMTGSSDARFFSRLGIQTYGFMPMQLPEDMRFNRILHSVNERIPVDTIPFGTDVLFRTMQNFYE